MCINISKLRFKKFFPCVYRVEFMKNETPTVPQINSENKKVYTRIFVIIVTNLISGMLTSLIGIAYYFDSLTNNCVINRDFKNWASSVTMLLFPLNSIINPYIYSFRLWKTLLKKCKQRLLECIMLWYHNY